MNSVEQALRARNKRLEQQNAALLMTLEKLVEGLELTESVGCAFAWDLTNHIDAQRAFATKFSSDEYYNATTDTADGIEEDALEGWERAMKEAASK